MAKTKSNPQSENNHQTSTDDDKLKTLKSLNTMLLKETAERRQQVDSLTNFNISLKSELNQYKSDAVLLKSELNGVTERVMMSEIEKESLSRIYSGQVSEMLEKIEMLEKEIVRICEERDEIRIQFIEKSKLAETESVNVEKLKIVISNMAEEKKVSEEERDLEQKAKNELQKSVIRLNELVGKLQESEGKVLKKLAVSERKCLTSLEKEAKASDEIDILLKEKEGLEASIQKLMKEKSLVMDELDSEKFILTKVCEERDEINARLVQKSKLAEAESVIIERLKIDISNMSEEKKVIEDQRDLEEKAKNELQKSVDGLNELVQKFQKSEEEILNKLACLEKECAMSSEKEAKTSIAIEILLKEKQEFEASIQKLTKEMDQLVKEKIEINDAKSEREANIAKLNEQLKKFKNSVAALEKSSSIQLDKLRELESEVSRHKTALDKATKERNIAQANLDGEKLNVKNLSEKISKKDKEFEDMGKKVSKMQKDTEKHVAEKKKLEKDHATLNNDMLVAKNSLAKTQKEHDATKGKLKVSEANTRQILKILKNTSLICNSKEHDNMGINEKTEFGEEIQHHVKEVETIKKAFRDKESTVDEMKKQLELLKVSVAEADKGKRFWTMVSSAATILTAVSLACVARGGC